MSGDVGSAAFVRAIVTAPPYADFLAEVAGHPLVAGFRLNTVMPLRETPEEVLRRLVGLGKTLYVDLKGRQLRVTTAANPPYTEVRLSHAIELRTPADAFFADGRERARVAAVDGNRLILADGPRRLVGPGESVNIPSPSLRVLGTLTETDRAYLAAMRSLGLTDLMLSYVEEPNDVAEVEALLPNANVVSKIESRRGLALVRSGKASGRLLAARGDLYVELRPHEIVGALKAIILADSRAIVASRFFESLVEHPVPRAADVTDAAFALELGYRTVLLGDSICFRRESVLAALNLLEAIAGQLQKSPLL